MTSKYQDLFDIHTAINDLKNAWVTVNNCARSYVKRHNDDFTEIEKNLFPQVFINLADSGNEIDFMDKIVDRCLDDSPISENDAKLIERLLDDMMKE